LHASNIFFDDLFVSTRSGLERCIGRPKRIGTFVDPYPEMVDLVSSYPHAFRDPETGRWRMLYNSYWPDGAEPQNLLLIAESDDGINWAPRDTTDVLDIPDRLLPHQVLPSTGYREAVTFRDERADPAARFRALVRYIGPTGKGEARVYVSSDGVRWVHQEGIGWMDSDVDLPAAVFWNDQRQSYLITCRPRMADRRVAIVETKDWVTYSDPVVVLQPDAHDTPLAEFYGMPVVRSGGAYVGFLWVYHTDPEQLMSNPLEPDHAGPHKYLDGRVDCQLAYGFNGMHFQRTLHETFVGQTELSEPDSGVANPYSMVDCGDTLRLFGSASRAEHGRRPVNSSAICIYELRKDGFVFLESSGTGSLTTRALRVQGPRLAINVEAPWGEVEAQLTDKFGVPLSGHGFADSEPFTGDKVSWQPSWTGGGLGNFTGQVVRLSLRIRHGRLYGVHGDFEVLVGPPASA
jgi:hypothetical protein